MPRTQHCQGHGNAKDTAMLCPYKKYILQDLRITAISVGAIRESPLHLGLDEAICVSPILENSYALSRQPKCMLQCCINICHW